MDDRLDLLRCGGVVSRRPDSTPIGAAATNTQASARIIDRARTSINISSLKRNDGGNPARLIVEISPIVEIA